MTEEDTGQDKSETAAAAQATPGGTVSGREAGVLERIEAFRRRRPNRNKIYAVAKGGCELRYNRIGPFLRWCGEEDVDTAHASDVRGSRPSADGSARQLAQHSS